LQHSDVTALTKLFIYLSFSGLTENAGMENAKLSTM